MKHTINVVTRLQDNGDGGYTLYAYNNEDELIADHPAMKDFRKGEDGKYRYFLVDNPDKKRKEILDEEDPYGNGYIGTNTIEVEIVDGVARLAKHLNFHAGQ